MSQSLVKVAIIGLDTSHSVELPKLMADVSIAPELRVPGMVPTRAMRFETPFQGKAGLDKRQAYLESIGVRVTEDFDETVGDCDAILLELNDPSQHLEFFEKCAGLGKPIFLDKPIADTLEHAREIRALAEKYHTKYFTSSALRFCPAIREAKAQCPVPKESFLLGPVGKAAAGSSIIWYGIHATEMLEYAMGPGAIAVQVRENAHGYHIEVSYEDGRAAVVSLGRNCYQYGGVLRDLQNPPVFFRENLDEHFYRPLLVEIGRFFQGGETPVPLEESFEIMALLEAMDKSARSGQMELVYRA